MYNFAGVRDDKGKSPLDRAMESAYLYGYELAFYLLSHGCDSNEKTQRALLFEACRRGKLNIVKVLVEQHRVDPKSESQNQDLV